MAPKKRSQTPRHSGVAESSESIVPQQQATSTLLSDQPVTDRHHRQRDSPRPLSSARSPTQDTVASSRSPIVSDSPPSPIEGLAPGSSSRRESSSTMRTSSISLDAASSCTPTGRISKAKKGKRVHACEFPGCGKVFTRAEHRRRHELNHNPEALFPCTRPGCRKAFHRMDLLQRHQERHDLESAADASGTMDHMAHIAVTSEASSSMAAPVMSSPQADRGAPRASSGGLSIGSLVHPQQDYRYNLGTPAFNGFTRQPIHYVPGFTSSDDSMFYTPESSQSPVSEYYGRYPHRQSISSSSSAATFDPNGASPLINGNMPHPWAPTSGPPSILPSTMLDNGSYLPVCSPFQAFGAYTEADQSPADSNLPIPLSDLDGIEWSVIRRELSNASGIQSGDPSAGLSDTIRWDCLEHYWQYFHPSFPVVHRPTFLPTKPSPLLASAMVAIGSQYDTRPDAKMYSLTLLEIATKLLRRRDNITSRSRLADLQCVFLLEILSKYCARRVEVEMSARFRSLFASLDQARRTLATDPLAVFRTLRKEQTADDIQRAHKFWLEHETRRRILQASTVLDLQQVSLFEQPATIIHYDRPKRVGPGGLRLNISLPCAEELWETSPIEDWVEMAKESDASSPTKGRSLQKDKIQAPKLDYFQIQVSLANNPSVTLDQLSPRNDQSGESAARLTFNRHLRDMAKNTPIRQLLVVSGESWIMGKKLENEAEFQDAKRNLRVWVDANRESRAAVWHATQLIRLRTKFTTSGSTNTDLSFSFHDTHMLHEAWAFYLAALVCWAYGFSASTMVNNSGHSSTVSEPTSNPSRSSSLSSVHPVLLDRAEALYSMREYLHNTNVKTVDDLLRLEPDTFGHTHGLLETIRLNKVSLSLGGLMNEAERVLYRLVEGRSRLSHF
ncbi:hypothetical protein H2200_011678 [Cladophialophora chaetospira]|uniref:C2H2-type domain-containing protein n=1 Tax=Cladophialophora chaetospira TaxID=386627 RepID=A0AA38WZT6_9EURO|nr:hypothetical protein H2200_011678 [Cladophialophora chaetospira]